MANESLSLWQSMHRLAHATWSWSMSASPVITIRFSILVSEMPPLTVWKEHTSIMSFPSWRYNHCSMGKCWQFSVTLFFFSFNFSITVDKQYDISFSCTREWLDIYIIYELIAPISLVTIWYHSELLRYHSFFKNWNRILWVILNHLFQRWG